MADNAPNGTFLDGFVRFASKTDGQPDLAVPYLGFYGDWGKAPILMRSPRRVVRTLSLQAS